MSEYDVTHLVRHSTKVKGVLFLFPDRVVFEPEREEVQKAKRALLRPCYAHGLSNCPHCGKMREKAYAECTERIVIQIDRIKDTKFAAEEDSLDALGIITFGLVLSAVLAQKHKILVIDFEDDYGILQHLVFEGRDMEEANEELYEIRKAGKLKGKSVSKEIG